MFDGGIHYRGGKGHYYWCEFERTLKGEYCAKRAHCRAMLAHIELWSKEARTRGREDIVDLLEIERAKASAALGRVLLNDLERGEGDSASGNGKGGDGKGGDGRVIPLWPPLLPLLSFLSITVGGYPL